MRHVRTRTAGERYYVGVPFARELDESERQAIADRLGTLTVPRTGRSDDRYTPTSVSVTTTYALVEYDHPAGDDQTPATIASAVTRAIGSWTEQYGPIGEPTRLGGADELGSLAAPSLDVSVDREYLRERLEAKHAGEAVGETPSIRGYVLAYPDRPLTDEEVSIIDAVVDESLLVTRQYVAFTDTEVHSISSPQADPIERLRAAVRNVNRPAFGDDVADRDFWPTREAGTLPSLGADEADVEAAIRDRARTNSPHPAPESEGEESDETATP